MSRVFDHLVLAVDDLDQASEFFERIGFTLTPRAQHPFGTGNRLAQLQGCFLEVLGITKPEDVIEAEPGAFSFGAYNRDYLTRGQGLSMIVMQTKDAAADREDFKSNGLTTYDMFDFSRLAQLPDGTEVTVGFTLAFTSVPALPDAMAFTCQQWRPDLFWKAEYQSHANGARAISEVFLIAVDAGPADTLKNGLALDPVAGKVSILSPMAFAARFPGVTAPSGRFGGYRISVEDLEAVRICMGENGVAYEDAPDSLWIAPESAFGCVIEFGEDQ